MLEPSTLSSTPPSSSRTYLVTGAAGFIGSHLCEALIARGDKVVGLDNFDPFYSPVLKHRNLNESLAKSPSFQLIEGDICDSDLVQQTFELTRPTCVIHLAAKAGVRPSIADPIGYTQTNLLGTSLLLHHAHQHGVSRFVLASSSSVYGNNTKVPFAESDDVSAPISPYAATKRACELLAFTHHSLTRMPTACLRFFTVYGPRQRPDLAIQLFLKKIAAGEPIQMFGDGSSSRDYTFVGDIVDGIIRASDRIDGFGYRIWNLGNSSPLSLKDMIQTISRVVGRDAKVTPAPAQAGDVERTYADISRSSAELGYAPKVGFHEGVTQHWHWLKAQHAH